MWQSQSGGQTVESNAKSGGELSTNSTGLGPYGVFFSGDIIGGEQAGLATVDTSMGQKNRALGIDAIFPYAVERVLFRICLMLIALDVTLLLLSGTEIAAKGYLQTLGIVLLCLAIATFYHVSGRSPHMAVGLRGMALLIVFSAAAACFNYLLLPVTRPSIDPMLVQIDALLGYHWPNVIAFAAENHWLSMATKFGYSATLPQLALLIILLGITGRVKETHKCLMALVLTALFSICFWSLFPSIGTSALYVLDPAIEAKAQLFIGTNYGQMLNQLVLNGPGVIRPDNIEGLIAFPSYHAVMACVGIWYSRSLKYFFPLFLLVNLLVIPGAPIHGGHHLVDIPAGILVFIVGAWIAHRIVEGLPSKEGAGLAEKVA